MGKHSVVPARGPDKDAVVATNRIRSAAGDYRAARQFRRQAEECRRSWEAGRAREIDHVLRRANTGDRRFRGLTEPDLVMIGTVRWAQSTQAHRLRRREERYAHRATLSLAFARFGIRIGELTSHGATRGVASG